MSSNDSILRNKRLELEQLEHLQEVSEQFVKVIKGINSKFDAILDGTKLVIDVSSRWNDAFQLINSNKTNRKDHNVKERDLLLIETVDDEVVKS